MKEDHQSPSSRVCAGFTHLFLIHTTIGMSKSQFLVGARRGFVALELSPELRVDVPQRLVALLLFLEADLQAANLFDPAIL